jgi:3-keto-5-aminohexanoate cleavage enzyme
MSKTIITSAVTGSSPTREMNPAVPYTPQEIAQAAIEAGRAGAAIAHIHVRHPQSGAPSHELVYFQEVVERVRGESDLILNLTTSGLHIEGELDEVIEKRLAPLSLKPELASLDVGSVNFKTQAFINPPQWGLAAAQRMLELGVKPEIEVFDVGHIAQAVDLIEQGLIKEPPWFQLCMGAGWGIPATEDNLRFMQSKLPTNALWSALGVGKTQQAMLTQGLQMGGHIRVGFEDNLYLRKGVLAQGNAELVAQAVEWVHAQGKDIAAPDEARHILGL